MFVPMMVQKYTIFEDFLAELLSCGIAKVLNCKTATLRNRDFAESSG
ncbi:hypothetical protein SAMN05444682_101490 [Parapedobacter indicus]|uniref:Uncharacterized protein n=1 Tax=Parapedobacter indicus TaxID=1477437 RepID=A0A1I3DJK6_9SPHI|nr:hypothetical protein CLV26_101503 [Parapedobacter indicus]SFH86681.1 hypothetical protein SAMN05444682_101490 [Parapedobacter indicus]